MNGAVSHPSTAEGSIAMYICDPGYELVGEETRVCLPNGSWSGEEPACEGMARTYDLHKNIE